MKLHIFWVALALAIFVLPSNPAEAGSRLTCLCNGKESSRIHHNRACEIHFKRKFKITVTGTGAETARTSRPEPPCTVEEWAQFRSYLCVQDRCTYPYVGSSTIKVPLADN
jgi:hypothetical protein